MIENTPQDRRRIAEEVNGRKSKSGKTIYPEYIYSTDEIVEQYREYAKRDLMMRYGDVVTPENKESIEATAEMYADMGAKFIAHDMPALVYFFRQYLTQH